MDAFVVLALSLTPAPAPPPVEVGQFPRRDAVAAALYLNMRYGNHLHERIHSGLERHRTGTLTVANVETQQLRKCWNLLDTVTDPSLDADYRRFWAGKLRQMIGERAYWRGEIPPPVPLWRFRSMD